MIWARTRKGGGFSCGVTLSARRSVLRAAVFERWDYDGIQPRGSCGYSCTSHTKASSRVLKSENSRREKLLRPSQKPRGNISRRTHADFLTCGDRKSTRLNS